MPPDPAAPPLPNRPRVTVPPAVLFGLATVFGLMGAWQHVRSMDMGGMHHGIPFTHGMAMRMPYWYAWALFVPFLQWFAHRFPLERMRWLRGAAIQLSVAAVVVIAHRAVQTGLERMLPQSLYALGDPYSRTLGAFVSDALSDSIGLYALLLGAAYLADYYARFRERELAASQLQGQLAHAQLQALRMQLNPHFLFNALNSIAMLVRAARNDEAVRMLAGLGDLLRAVLDDERPHEVPLRDELDFLRRYLDIEQIRAGRLRVSVDVAPDAMEARVPNLILQPIVENAIRHGIARSSAAGLVEIGAWRENGSLLLSVRDDGPGVGDGATDGVGLRNTRARLARMYGDAQTLEMGDADGGGTRVTLRIPFRAAAEAA